MSHWTSSDERFPDMPGIPKDGFAATPSPSSDPLCCGTRPRKETYLRAIGDDDDISRLPQRRWRKNAAIQALREIKRHPECETATSALGQLHPSGLARSACAPPHIATAASAFSRCSLAPITDISPKRPNETFV